MSPDSKRRPRSDAQRNRERLITATRELVAEFGSEVPLDEVARRAGLGNATLYRHFPTRAELLAALYADEVTALCDYGNRLLAEPSPIKALFSWLDAFVTHVATKRPLALAATDIPDGRRTPMFEQWHADITTTASALVRRAQPMLRQGVTATDVLALASGAALTTDVDNARRLVAMLHTGLATQTHQDRHRG
ncbi:helix-turn-helix domain containing protein [Asanoa sp. WMMD1127]|uniref:TetR/AcrR family transcriptional regulator n=1 Tax=Asanoa sp. WMMD1127 TaxID=3016107 RepID=UPI0024168119|nr:TetR/AcrR family transcriptional regulator [Asanoa sp. WMMD1127]MDG4824856.1 helix-turn-helix domain containing protein [Asanoa sp. WMMD1127]